MFDTGKEYRIFELFQKQWGLVTAGPLEDHNACTVSWGSLGTLWSHGRERHIVTVYINPARYTCLFLRRNEEFTLSFFPEAYRKDLAYLGDASGRDGDKIARTSLHRYALGNAVAYEEAELTFRCRKIYQDQFERTGMAQEIDEGVYEGWEPHCMFIGEILEVIDHRD